MQLLKGKIAVITGAASARGLGKATAQMMSDHGAKIAILDLDQSAAVAAAADIGADHIGLACDVTDQAACAAAVNTVTKKLGAIDVLVNNAGITQPLKFMDIAPENYDAVLDVNLRGTLYMSQAVIPAMRARKSGAIVIFHLCLHNGVAGFLVAHIIQQPRRVFGIDQAMARELAPDGVRANAVCPGFIATDITGGMLTDDMMTQILNGIPMGRAGTAQDVAGCCVFLASDLSAYVTGSEVM